MVKSRSLTTSATLIFSFDKALRSQGVLVAFAIPRVQSPPPFFFAILRAFASKWLSGYPTGTVPFLPVEACWQFSPEDLGQKLGQSPGGNYLLAVASPFNFKSNDFSATPR